ncbi:Clp protease N-terminal domain-containing protein [Roseibium salinum]|uniref:Clp R domain-containing protein n=1 Tax=Roseibium salinum TaxID=1604349 RepID=A0ABT3R153_9HYPH|nr:Clp protease N-terminal domain-containing protein [Roseibium sp. DSM 29163]MCX2722943.1 hypothetical protein [Roseibium sp. DSM 29163]
MSDILVETVANKLTTVSYECLERAMRLTKSSGHRNLEILQWLYYLARDENTDFVHVLRHFGIDVAEVHTDLQKAISELKINQTELPSMAAPFQEALERAWFEGTLRYGDYKIRSAYVLIAMLGERTTARQLRSYSSALDKLNRDIIVRDLDKIAGTSGEAGARPVDGSGPKAAAPAGAKGEVRRQPSGAAPARMRWPSSRSTSPPAQGPRSSIRSSAGTTKSARSSTS